MILYYQLGAKKRLNEIVMAGRHNAGITKGGGNAMTQKLDIQGQALAGVRLFDLRVAGAGATSWEKNPLARTIPDPLHSDEEDRFVNLGESKQRRLLVVVFTDRGENIRIISARMASRRERRDYEEDAQSQT